MVYTKHWASWSVARGLANSRLPQASATIPAIGYVLLWSEQFSVWLKTQSVLGEPILPLSINDRLYCLWWGAVLMTVGWLLYRWRCPTAIRRCGEPEDYVMERLQMMDTSYARSTAKELKKFAEALDITSSQKIAFGKTPSTVVNFSNAVIGAENPYDPRQVKFLSVIILLHFRYLDHSQPVWRYITSSFLTFGAVIFLIPSADVFLRVVRNML